MVDESAANVRKGLLAAAIGGLLFTLDLPLLRLAGLDQWTLVFGRGLFLFISISVGWLLLRRRAQDRQPFIAGRAGLGAVITNTVAPITNIAAVATTNAANIVFIMALIPLLTALFSRIFIGERVRPVTWGATLLALAGVSIIVGDSLGQGRIFGDMMALASATCTAMALTIIRASGKQMATSLATGSLLSAMIALAIFQASPLALAHDGAFGMPAWFWLGINGLLTIPLAIALIAASPRLLPSVDVSMFFLLETVLTPVWIWLLTGEHPTRQASLGGAVIVFTLIGHSLWRLRLSRGSRATATEF